LVVGPTALAEAAINRVDPDIVFVDEPPPGSRTQCLSPTEIEHLRMASSSSYLTAEWRKNLARAIDWANEVVAVAELPDDPTDQVALSLANPDAGSNGPIGLMEAQRLRSATPEAAQVVASALETAQALALLRLGRGVARLDERRGGAWIATAEPLYDYLRGQTTVMGCAFPKVDEVEELLTSMGFNVTVVAPVIPPKNANRIVVAAGGGGRGRMASAADHADRLLTEGVREVRSSSRFNGKLLVVSHKPVADRWRDETPDALMGLVEVHVAHFGQLRGLNDWSGWSTLTVGDPWQPPPAAEARAARAEIDAQDLLQHLAADEIAQAHGRARPLREGPLVQVHVGRVAPAGWTSSTIVRSICGPRSGDLTPDDVQELIEQAGSAKALAKLSGVSASAISRAKTGKTTLSKANAEKLRAAFPRSA
jgi:hypothetical protein